MVRKSKGRILGEGMRFMFYIDGGMGMVNINHTLQSYSSYSI